MDNALLVRLLPSILKAKGQADISVVGVSMEPTLFARDIITVAPTEDYTIGDILVYPYKNEGLLVHRLLRIDERCFCKGDNAFRLEDIAEDAILGKVILRNGTPIAPWPSWKTALSYAVNRQFVRCRYDIDALKSTAVYQTYHALIFHPKESTLMYVKNNAMDYILSDDTSLAVFDPASGNTYFFDEIGIDILRLLEQPQTAEGLLEALGAMYLAAPGDMQNDVEEFLAYTVSKGIVNVV